MNYLPVLFGYEASNIGNSHVALSLCRHWHESGRAVQLTLPGAVKGLEYPWLRTAMKGLRQKLTYKFGTNIQARTMAEQLFYKHEKDADIVYLWAGLSLEIFEAFHKRGSRIVIERINCHRKSSWRILEAAADTWNIPYRINTDEKAALIEAKKLEIADAVFCPSPMVRKSMLENGVEETKLLSTSYGWAPERFPGRNDEKKHAERPVFLFVGSICLRKGIPLLLEAWKRAKLDADLVLCGNIAPEIQEHLPPLESYPNVRHISYTHDMGMIYRSADVFVFPSLEEGGPMVTYEAMAHGIPCLVSEMGAGAIVEKDINGIVLPDMDIDAWAEALTSMALNRQARIDIGQHARERAERFIWKKVANHRAELLEQCYPMLWKDQGNATDH
ncbi:glycosyltransferase [Chlorobium phaeovibrioides]|uniref:Glycosyltransferase n=1 Tax=Chlorobium phaeovibrioides TaxID=1094 RepID=A0A3S0LPL6_CHLPH|nr:glycosyltransferase family 4 protein [Chlorobium phaeovibrioides]RTY37776.1 glycosyltransferase [Chlorobium phaeovibrioides]